MRRWRRERVLELIEVDKVVQRREKEEERRKEETARVESDETSRGSGFDRSNTAYAFGGAMSPRTGSSRPDSSSRSGQSHQSDVRRLPRSASRPSSPSSLSTSYDTGPSKTLLPLRSSNLSTTRHRPATPPGAGERDEFDQSYTNDEGYFDQGYTPRSNNNNNSSSSSQKSSQRFRPPLPRLTPEGNLPNRSRPSLPPSSQNDPSRPSSSSKGTRLDRPSHPPRILPHSTALNLIPPRPTPYSPLPLPLPPPPAPPILPTSPPPDATPSSPASATTNACGGRPIPAPTSRPRTSIRWATTRARIAIGMRVFAIRAS